MFRLFFLLIIVSLAGCASLEPGAERVRMLDHGDRGFGIAKDKIAKECSPLTTLDADDDPGAGEKREFKNYALKLGADTILIEEAPGYQNHKVSYFRCGTPAAVPAPAPR